MQLIKNQRGQGLIEYVILVALVGVACMGFVRVLQSTVKVNIGRVVDSLQGHEHRASYETIRTEDYRKSDFSNFMNGAASRDRDSNDK